MVFHIQTTLKFNTFVKLPGVVKLITQDYNIEDIKQMLINNGQKCDELGQCTHEITKNTTPQFEELMIFIETLINNLNRNSHSMTMVFQEPNKNNRPRQIVNKGENHLVIFIGLEKNTTMKVFDRKGSKIKDYMTFNNGDIIIGHNRFTYVNKCSKEHKVYGMYTAY